MKEDKLHPLAACWYSYKVTPMHSKLQQILQPYYMLKGFLHNGSLGHFSELFKKIQTNEEVDGRECTEREEEREREKEREKRERKIVKNGCKSWSMANMLTLTLKLPGPSAGMGGYLRVTIA